MPELPEVETIRRQLAEAVTGKKIARVEILNPSTFIGDPKAAVGSKIAAIGRQAKVLKIIFANGNALFAHFKLNGQFFFDTGKEKFDTRFTRVILRFDDGTRLLFNDSRKFAWMKVVTNYKEEESGAIEPFKDNFTMENFSDILSKTRKPVKILLMDQEKIGGIGNIYANESLFKAGIDPFRPANSLKPGEAKKLHGAIIKILQKAIDCHGSSGKDEWYRQLNGKTGGYQEHFLVYQRDGQKCPGECDDEVKRIKQAGRSTFYCPKCQK
jgi:formamidopyrimidine-DNA glycosylase